MLRTLLNAPSFSPWKPQAAAQKPYPASQSLVPANAWHVSTTFSGGKIPWHEKEPEKIEQYTTQLLPYVKGQKGHATATLIKNVLVSKAPSEKAIQALLNRLEGKSLQEIRSCLGLKKGTLHYYIRTLYSALTNEGISIELPALLDPEKTATLEKLAPLVAKAAGIKEEKASTLLESLAPLQLSCMLAHMEAPQEKQQVLAEKLFTDIDSFRVSMSIVRKLLKKQGINVNFLYK